MLGKNMEMYVDDMLLKLAKCKFPTTDNKNAFECMRKHNVNLNPTKCAFGVKFMGFIVSERGTWLS